MARVKLRLNSGEEVIIGKSMDQEVMDRYFALLDVATKAAEPKQTIPDSMMVVWEVGQELGLWMIVENTQPDYVEGRVY